MTGRYDVTAMGATTWDDYLTGYGEGYRHGIARGRELEREEAAQLWQVAASIVRAAADSPERDHAADERSAERSSAWWAERRGESGPKVEGRGGGS